MNRMREMTLTEALSKHILDEYGSQAAAARAYGCSQSFVSQVLSGAKKPTDLILADAGIEIVTSWFRTSKHKGAK